jgi:DNA-binding CsgD family transcriptional regulator
MRAASSQKAGPDLRLVDLSTLSRSERQVFERARSGATAREPARQLSLSEATVRTHLSHIYGKLGVRGRVELFALLQRSSPWSRDHSVPPEAHDGHVPAKASRLELGAQRPILIAVVGALVGIAAGIVLLPATAVSPPAVLLLPLLAGAPVAVVIARRPGGLDFFAALIGACGAVLVALSLAPGLSCPAGEFSSECVRPAIAPILLPGLGLMIVGLLLAGYAKRRGNAHAQAGPRVTFGDAD